MLTYLLTLVSEDKRDTVIRIYERFSARFMRIAIKRLRRARIPSYEHLAEDVVQTTFEKIIRGIDIAKYSDKRVTFYRFSYVILKNEICTAINKEINRLEHEVSVDDVAEPYEDELIHARLEYKSAVRIIAKMDERYSTVLYLYCVEDMAPADIAAVLDIPANTVYTRLRRGMDALRKHLGGGEL